MSGKIVRTGIRVIRNTGVSINIANAGVRKIGNTDVRKILETGIRIIGNTGNSHIATLVSEKEEILVSVK